VIVLMKYAALPPWRTREALSGRRGVSAFTGPDFQADRQARGPARRAAVERTTRDVSLTDTGRAYLERAGSSSMNLTPSTLRSATPPVRAAS